VRFGVWFKNKINHGSTKLMLIILTRL